MLPEQLNKFSKENIRKGPVTTVVGCIIIVVSLVSLFTLDKVNWAEASIGILIGALFAFSKDKKDKGEPPVVMLVALLLLFSGCNVCEKCLNKYGTNTHQSTSDSSRTDKTVERETKDSIITAKGDQVGSTIQSPCDSNGILKHFKYQLLGNNRKAVATIEGKNNALHVNCECAEEQILIRFLQERVRELTNSKNTTYHKTTQIITEKQKVIPWYAKWQVVVSAALLAWVAGRFKFIF